MTLCACDGIGRHARFRFSCSNACGFESLQAYQKKESEPALNGARFGFFHHSVQMGRWDDPPAHTQTGGSDRKRGQADGIKANRWMESVSGLAHQLKEWLLSRLGCPLGGQLGSEREVHCAVGILTGRHSADTGERWEPFLLCVREYQSECPFLMAGDSR